MKKRSVRWVAHLANWGTLEEGYIMKRILYPLIMFLGLVGTTQAQGIPKELEESGLCGVKYPPQLSRAGAKMKPGR